MLVDSHCHLDFPQFANDLDGVVDRAGEAGVGVMLTICTHVTRFDRVLGHADQMLGGDFGHFRRLMGMDADRTPDVFEAFRQSQHPKVVGFGESGLDYYYEHSPRASQQRSFRAHIAAAREADLPLVVHTRDADAATRPKSSPKSTPTTGPSRVSCIASARPGNWLKRRSVWASTSRSPAS